MSFVGDDDAASHDEGVDFKRSRPVQEPDMSSNASEPAAPELAAMPVKVTSTPGTGS